MRKPSQGSNRRREILYSWCLAGITWNHTRASGSVEVLTNPPLSFARILGNVPLAASGIVPIEVGYVFISSVWLGLGLKCCTPNSAVGSLVDSEALMHSAESSWAWNFRFSVESKTYLCYLGEFNPGIFENFYKFFHFIFEIIFL